jgi:hypothetical protein
MDIHWVQWGKMQKKERGFEKSEMLARSGHFTFRNIHQE